MEKPQVIATLEEIALLLELKGENVFKIRAYQNAARTLEGITEDLANLIKEDRLGDLKGFGPALVEKVTELVTTGKCRYFNELKKSVPASLLEMLAIAGLGPKKTKKLYEDLGIKTVKQLEAACQKNRLLTLEGFGEKSQQKILAGITFLEKGTGRHRYDEAREGATQLVSELKKLKGITRIKIAGSLRRHEETIGDIDILVSAQKAQAVMDSFTKLNGVHQVLAHGATKSSVLLDSGIQVDLRVMTAQEFPYALHYFTGNKEHNVVMRQRAQKKGLKLNEYGLFKGRKLVPCKDEAAIFKHLGLQYIPPELRVGLGEFEVAEKNKIPKLIEEQDIKGVFHVHSTYSDGRNTLEEMIAAACALGLQYVGISDHSQSAHYAGGLEPARVKKQRQEIERLQKKYPIRIFHGIESDILKNGSLDYAKPVLASFDFIIGSIHSSFKMPEKEMTRRLIKAIQNPYLTMIGHLTGRLLLSRAGYMVDHQAIIQACHDYGKTIELNASPHRFDLDWRWLPVAKGKKLKIPINPDAHSIKALGYFRYGVGIARKGWLTKKDVLTTLPVWQMEKFLSA